MMVEGMARRCRDMSDIEAHWEQPFGDGTAAIQILDTVVETSSQEGTK